MNPYTIPERVWSLLSNLRASMQLLLPRSEHVRRQVAAIATLLIGSEAAAHVSLMRRLQNSLGNAAATFAPDQTAEMQETAPTETGDGNRHRRLSSPNPLSAMPACGMFGLKHPVTARGYGLIARGFGAFSRTGSHVCERG